MSFWELVWEVVLPTIGVLTLIFLGVAFVGHLYDLLQLAAKCS